MGTAPTTNTIAPHQPREISPYAVIASTFSNVTGVFSQMKCIGTPTINQTPPRPTTMRPQEATGSVTAFMRSRRDGFASKGGPPPATP